MDNVYMTLGKDGAGHEFPDQPGVIEHFEARGWVKADPPKETPFVSSHGDVDPEQLWVTLYHPELKTTHEFPNNPGAIEGAHDSGWIFPEEDKSSSKKTAAKKTAGSAKSADTDKEN